MQARDIRHLKYQNSTPERCNQEVREANVIFAYLRSLSARLPTPFLIGWLTVRQQIVPTASPYQKFVNTVNWKIEDNCTRHTTGKEEGTSKVFRGVHYILYFCACNIAHPGGNALDGATAAWCNCAYKWRVNVIRASTKRGAAAVAVVAAIACEPSEVPFSADFVPDLLVGFGSKRTIRTPSFLSGEQNACTAAATSPGLSRNTNATARGRKHLFRIEPIIGVEPEKDECKS